MNDALWARRNSLRARGRFGQREEADDDHA
jgi:hypothetical protein